MSKSVRCAIYTRKSSEEGLDQSFNSLHAQREAGEAYVRSQVGEGWVVLDRAYDDGGFSGGSMERPGLAQLLRDVAAGRIDIVVVYKVDRLTRSLTDFAKIVETFDAHGVSFVSVTQAFNTTTSMGRLTLNVLLSFAQFEREVTGERIRDKIAASKAKGMWMGGVLPLGYDAPTDQVTRALVVNEPEAGTVRLIFQRYLELGSVHALRDWLDDQQIRSKAWVTKAGRPMGGFAFNRGSLFHLLKNRTYLGEVPHKDKSYPGIHPAIVDADVFDRVQVQLEAQGVTHRARPTKVSQQMLRGLLFDADGHPMCPSFTRKGGEKVYRYYVSSPLQQGVRLPPGGDAIRRVPGDIIEAKVRGVLAMLKAPLKGALVRVEVHPSTLQLIVNLEHIFGGHGDGSAQIDTLRARLGPAGRIVPERGDSQLGRVTLACRLKSQGGRTWLLGDGGGPPSPGDPTMAKGLSLAHQIAAGLSEGTSLRPETLTPHEAPSNPYRRKLAALAFLAPDIQAAIVEGRHPQGLTIQGVLDRGVPPSWAAQRRLLGFAADGATIRVSEFPASARSVP